MCCNSIVRTHKDFCCCSMTDKYDVMQKHEGQQTQRFTVTTQFTINYYAYAEGYCH